jgi:hypothetical protein
MRTVLGLVVLAVSALACAAAEGDKDRPVVNLDGLKSRVPAGWKKEEPKGKMRFAQFKLPHAKDDTVDAELVIFKNAGGTAKQNIERWKAQFVPPRGKSTDDVVKVTDLKIAGHKATYVDLQGTYNPPPFNPTFGGKKWPHFRMLAVQLEGPDNLYHILLTGPAATVEHHKKEFDEWLKGFKK